MLKGTDTKMLNLSDTCTTEPYGSLHSWYNLLAWPEAV